MASLLRTMLSSRTSLVFNNVQGSWRNISKTALRCEKTAAATVIKEPPTNTVNPSDMIGGRQHQPNRLEKRFLVWSGKFKSVADVPDTVSQEAMEKSRNKARIKIANYMILATIAACVGVAISGKNAAKRGESVQQMNLDWHKQIKEEANAAIAAGNAAK